MFNKNGNFFTLLKHLGVLMLIYSLCRILFYVFNSTYFSSIEFPELPKLLFFGLRFDLSVIILINFLFIVLYLLPFPIIENKIYRGFIKWVFVISNGFFILANLVDLVYFRYTLKRTNFTVFNFFSGRIGSDLKQLAPVFITEFWYLFVFAALFVFALIKLYTKQEAAKSTQQWTKKHYISQSIQFLIAVALSILAYRGGFQLKPIGTATAGEYVDAKNISLVLNTPFCILKTIDMPSIQPSTVWHINNKDELKALYNPIHSEKSIAPFKGLNVVVIALESFSKEFIGSINNRTTDCTPFLDSLMQHSLVCTDAYANGKTSIDGIPSVINGIPTWMYEPYITSAYNTNQVNSLASLLKKEGYTSLFFHGGSNGTMGFDAFCNITGYDYYHGRNEYNNDKDFDGNWGIWDEEFLGYTADVLNKTKQPFVASVFTLSSHHPYPIPEKYKNTFKEGKLPLEKSIRYTDYSLRKFFEKAQQMNWFKNTLFVFAADHTGVSEDPYYLGRLGNYAIPIIYYQPQSSLVGIDSNVTQQIDILPSVMDYLNYPHPYFAFGNSIFDTTAQRFALASYNNQFQYIENNYALQFNGNESQGLYLYKQDSLLQYNLLKEEQATLKKMDMRVKAVVQTYQESLMNNKMIP